MSLPSYAHSEGGAQTRLAPSGTLCPVDLARSVDELQLPQVGPRGVQSAETTLLTYSRWVKHSLPLLPLPDVHQPRQKTLPTNFTPRRSPRLAASTQQRVLAAQQTKLMLVATLGVTSHSGTSAVTKFHKLFDNPLTDHITALVALFRMSVPASLPSDSVTVATSSTVAHLVPAC